jgi:hypothetical protein
MIWCCYRKFDVGCGKILTTVTRSELSSSINLDLSDIDVFNSDSVITRASSWGFIDFCDNRVRSIIMKSNEMMLSGGPVNHNEVALKVVDGV